MADGKGKKRIFISISSEEEDESVSDSESVDDDDDSDEAYEDEGEDSISCDEKGNESDDEEESTDEAVRDIDTTIRLYQEKSSLQELSVKDCKAYLRKHGLRVSGTKPECIQRIMEHCRIKNGNGEALYPRSSFTINCTGDVCQGDVVFFTQKVYAKFEKMTRRGTLLGKRIVAGRVVKESYGAAKQQHTFTVEVLWSRGIKQLPTLFPLLVKGRNLYKLKTFRQPWKSEAKRLEVLDEKHKRGAAARLVRAKKKMNSTTSKSGGAKRQKNSHHATPSQAKRTTKSEKGKRIDERRKPSKEYAKQDNHRQRAPASQQVNSRDENHTHRYYRDRNPGFQPYTHSFPYSEVGSTSTTMPPSFRPYANSSFAYHPRPLEYNHSSMYSHPAYHHPPPPEGYNHVVYPPHHAHVPQSRGFNHDIYPRHAYSHRRNDFEWRNFGHFP